MIRLTRPPSPAGHTKRASIGTKKLWDAWNATGITPKADSNVYAHFSVKLLLRKTQNNKCAYCETLNPTSHDVVEHFRPKNGWRQQRGDLLQQPAYFWLSYQWENLVFACDTCNDSAHKGNLFPISNSSQRADAINPDIANEEPLLINPYVVDPEQYIEWNRDIPRPRNKSRQGHKSIKVFGLDKDGLMTDQRRQYLQKIEEILKLVESATTGNVARKDVVMRLIDCLEDSAPWVAMVRSNFSGRIHALTSITNRNSSNSTHLANG